MFLAWATLVLMGLQTALMLAGGIKVIFWAGSLVQRVADLERRMTNAEDENDE